MTCFCPSMDTIQHLLYNMMLMQRSDWYCVYINAEISSPKSICNANLRDCVTEHLYSDIIGESQRMGDRVWERNIRRIAPKILNKIPNGRGFFMFTTPHEIYVIAMPIQIMGLCITCCSPAITLDDDGDDDQENRSDE